MATERRAFLILQGIGGPAVLGSYVTSFARWPEAVGAMWGGVPESIRGLYTAWMFVAAAGYLLFTGLFWLRTRPDEARLLGGGFGRLLSPPTPSSSSRPRRGCPSPASCSRRPSAALWWTIVAVLWMVAAGSLALLAAVATLAPRWPGRLRSLALGGAVAFCVQTVALDAIVWPALFDVPAAAATAADPAQDATAPSSSS